MSYFICGVFYFNAIIYIQIQSCSDWIILDIKWKIIVEKQIARIETKLDGMEKRIEGIIGSLRELQTKESAGSVKDACEERSRRLEERIIKIEGSLSKVVWIVLTAIISAILYLVIRT